MATATKTTTATKTKTPLETEAELRAIEAERAQEASHLVRELTDKQRRLFGWLDDHGLISELEGLRQREPDTFDADGNPRPGTAAAKLQAEAEAMGDLAELTRRVEQARRLLNHATLQRRQF